MGAFLLMSSDLRIAAEGTYGIGMNEVAIGLTVPRFAIEIARHKLTPAYFNRAVATGEMFLPAAATVAGFVHWTVPAETLETAVYRAAQQLGRIDFGAHMASKLRAREPAIKAVRAAIDHDITIDFAKQRMAQRTGNQTSARRMVGRESRLLIS
jgi:enoyl-CoA hydratase